MDIDYEGSRQEFLELLGQLGDPAFVRRARMVEDAERSFIAQCRVFRNELLDLAKMRMGRLAAIIDHDWTTLQAFVAGTESVFYLQNRYDEWSPQLQLPVPPSSHPKKIRQALKELVASFEFFNKRWREYLDQLSFDGINGIRDEYNRYYVIEKSCAFQSDKIGQLGFVEKRPFTVDELLSQLPLLEIPVIVKN